MATMFLTEDECYWTLGALTVLDVQRQVDDHPHRELTDYVAQNMADIGRHVANATKQNHVRDFDLDIATRLAVDFVDNMGDMDDRVLSYLFVRVQEPTKNAAPFLKEKFNAMHKNGIQIKKTDQDIITLGDYISEDQYCQKQTIANGKLIARQIAQKMGVKI